MTFGRGGRPFLAMCSARFPSLRRFVLWIFDKRSGLLLFALKTTVAAKACTVVLLVPVILAQLSNPQDDHFRAEFTVMAALVFAPLFENICMVGVIEFLGLFALRWQTIVLSVAVLSGIAHYFAGGWRALGGFLMFATMAYSYLVWSELRFSKRYLLTVAQHVLSNTPTTLLMVSGLGD